MKKLFFGILVMYSMLLTAEEVNLDSLKQLLSTNIDDTLRLQIKMEIGYEPQNFRLSYWDSLIIDCDVALKRSQTQAEKEVVTFLLAAAYNNTGYLNKYYGDIEKARRYYKKSIQLNLKLRNAKDETLKKLALQDLAQTVNNLAVIIVNNGNVDKGLKFYEYAFQVRLFVDDKEGAALTLNNMGYVASSYGDVKKSMAYYFESLKIREDIKDSAGMAQAYGNIATLYAKQKDFEEAYEYHQKALVIYRSVGDNEGVARALNNIGTNYLELGELDSCEKYYNVAFELRKEVNYKDGIANSLYNLGHLAVRKNEKEKAIDFLKKSLDIYKVLNYKIKISECNHSLSEMYYLLNDISSAKKHAEISYQLSLELNNPDQISSTSKANYLLFKNSKDFEKALEMLEIHIEMRDSVVNKENQKELLKQLFKHNYEKQKAYDDAEHQKQLAIEQEVKNKQRVIIFSGIIVLLLVVLFSFVIFNRLRVTRQQKLVIEEQKTLVEEKNQEITDSITYAKRIQSAILPSSKVVKEYLEESFILYKPKDIVAGDFYWMEAVNSSLKGGLKEGDNHPSNSPQGENVILFAAADCTGHGVPGAMVSVVCNNALNRSVREHGLTDPGEILDKSRDIVIAEFKKSDEEVKDGMDIALCALKGMTLKYAGAHNPLWIVRGSDIIEIKANKQPIGKFDNPEPYTTHTIELQKGDTIYIFSDGYVDQFGGGKGKKFKAKAFRELLLSIQQKTMEEQRLIIDETFEAWRGEIEQIDDVCVIGVRV
ncbi:MAG: tetratricopeptide repeat protein [Flavobacteriales bacterium]|nr:tetratricopeptide repeat protein [Flavobacteriales bacterium]MCB9365140.1 tetratricopeptide repeat protein [Flavobacteriales bacterium]